MGRRGPFQELVDKAIVSLLRAKARHCCTPCFLHISLQLNLIYFVSTLYSGRNESFKLSVCSLARTGSLRQTLQAANKLYVPKPDLPSRVVIKNGDFFLVEQKTRRSYENYYLQAQLHSSPNPNSVNIFNPPYGAVVGRTDFLIQQ